MTTLSIMKARIADELARSDLTSQIGYAISDAIKAHHDTRFYFNEGRSLTFSTVANQEFYSSSDAADIANILSIDAVTLLQSASDTPYKLTYERPESLEQIQVGSYGVGQPTSYTLFARQLRLYPVPSTSGWTVRVIGAMKIAEPASDGETSNAWMTEAERLIRSRAKYEIALHVTYDSEMAEAMAAAVKEAERQLKDRTNMLTQAEKGFVQPFCF